MDNQVVLIGVGLDFLAIRAGISTSSEKPSPLTGFDVPSAFQWVELGAGNSALFLLKFEHGWSNVEIECLSLLRHDSQGTP